MLITVDAATHTFHLHNRDLSYVMQVKDQRFLLQVYYGKRIHHYSQILPYPEVERASTSPNPSGYAHTNFTLDTAMQEFPGSDGDYRESAFSITYADGTQATALEYVDYRIIAGKPKLEGLPATYAAKDQSETLVIELKDVGRHLGVTLQYTIFSELPVITRSVQYHNIGVQTIYLDKALSMALDRPDANYQMIQLPGAWAREKQLVRTSLASGTHVLSSRRGASSAQQQPFMALVRPETTENSGEVFAFHFVYSGNFQLTASVDAYQQTRITGGIGATHFRWQLQPQATFQTPEMVMVYSAEGLNAMSQTFHQLYRQHLARGRYRNELRPVIINNWETTYFDFDEDRLLKLAGLAKQIGVELFVLDDGWFGHRDSDNSSLGDWQVDSHKLPNGLASLSKHVHELGMKFGLWFEPEMISPDSDLFRAHPDWVLNVPDFPMSQGRNQLVLDFSRADVRDAIRQQLEEILSTVEIDFVKWDMNRNITAPASRQLPASQQQETLHRYILGLYALVDEITTKYPDVLFENCAAGGGRFDPGMCYYMPQSWASDDTDAYERLKIQYGTSLIFPPVMIDAHLSEIPNDQVGRATPLESRIAISQSANFGLMMNLEQKTPAELQVLKTAIDDYKLHRQLIQFGDFYRLMDPFTQPDGAWMFVDPEKKHVRVVYMQGLNKASKPNVNVKLVGLDPAARYQSGDQQWYGDELMNYGLYLNYRLIKDFQTIVVDLVKI
jgi:alpha-galactosidase